MDLSTHYLGLKLANPLMPGSSPLSDDPEMVKRLVDHGAAAIVMRSIYAEQITPEATERLWYEEVASYPLPSPFSHGPRGYLDRIAVLKKAVKVPIVASINCTTGGDWVDYAAKVQAAGADALELSIYLLPTDPEESAEVVEKRLVEIVAGVCGKVTIPVAVKLSSFYTSLPYVARQLEKAGARGLVLFNRFYQPDAEAAEDPKEAQARLAVVDDQAELRLRLRWLAILSGVTKMSLAITGSVRTGKDAMKGVMAGAHAVQIVSSLQGAGPTYLQTVLEGLENQMRQAGATSVEGMRGCINEGRAPGEALPGQTGVWRAIK